MSAGALVSSCAQPAPQGDARCMLSRRPLKVKPLQGIVYFSFKTGNQLPPPPQETGDLLKASMPGLLVCLLEK
jgi:hypothetical protein